MIPELGHVALILALQMALAQSVLSIVGASNGNTRWMSMGRGAAVGQMVFVLAGFGALAWAFYANDFSVLNVAEHSSRHLPLVYRLTATWGSHEGSMLLWTMILSCWVVTVTLTTGHLPMNVSARVIGVMGLVSVGFLAFILFTSNPFLRLDPPPPDGLDLNPLLQDPGMVLHPPLLYMGYVGFSVAFAFALAALLSGRLDASWARWSRPWTLVAWFFLTIGIMVGSWWAYYELGWGGWWFWDPTENASLMPWLVGTALVHSLAVTDKQGGFKVWTVFLAIAAFSLCLVGTFLVRSGVLSSVHAFAQDPARGFFILLFLVMVIGGSWLLFALRVPKGRISMSFSFVSRESVLMLATVLLFIAMATVMLGTLYPLLLDALDLGKVSVGPPYFNAVFVPLMTPVLMLTGFAWHIRWRESSLKVLTSKLRWHGLAALVVGAALPLLVEPYRWQAALALVLALWIVLTTGQGLVERLRSKSPFPRPLLGMSLAHVGAAILVVGVGLVSAYETEANLVMQPGSTTTLAGYTVTFKELVEDAGPNYSAARATLLVTKNQHHVGELKPEKRVYHASKMPMTESAIIYGFTGDLYVALGDPLQGDSWGVRLFYKPFVGWIWVGAMVMAMGGLLAAFFRRQHRG